MSSETCIGHVWHGALVLYGHVLNIPCLVARHVQVSLVGAVLSHGRYADRACCVAITTTSTTTNTTNNDIDDNSYANILLMLTIILLPCREVPRCRAPSRPVSSPLVPSLVVTPDLPTNIAGFRGFDSSTILILRG